MQALRVVLIVDAAVLFLLGASFLFAPGAVALTFGFQELPRGAYFLIGLWGCALLTMALGYVAATRDPFRHAIWVQVGIARGTLECLVGIVYMARGIVTPNQALVGTVMAGVIALAYLALYPRDPALPVEPR